MPVVIDCCHVHQTDFTAAKGFKAMLADFQGRSQPVHWLNPSPAVVHVIKFIAGEAFHTITSVEGISGSEEQRDQVRSEEPLLDESNGRMGPMLKDSEREHETA